MFFFLSLSSLFSRLFFLHCNFERRKIRDCKYRRVPFRVTRSFNLDYFHIHKSLVLTLAHSCWSHCSRNQKVVQTENCADSAHVWPILLLGNLQVMRLRCVCVTVTSRGTSERGYSHTWRERGTKTGRLESCCKVWWIPGGGRVRASAFVGCWGEIQCYDF